MLNSTVIRELSNVFIGDSGVIYKYKTGPELVSFFNQYFSDSDVYQSPFPSRWVYVHDKLVNLKNNNKLDSFFTKVLNKEYFLIERKGSEFDSLIQADLALQEFNKILKPYSYIISKRDNQFKLVKLNDDLEFIGQGGFANVYYQKSSGYVVKKLKDDYMIDTAIRSRFKREYEITKSLSDIELIVDVIDFDSSGFSYRMEKAEETLEDYISENNLGDSSKITVISQILYVMDLVHSRGIIHRDLSPNNIFIAHGLIKIADFGLGKDLNIFASHQTMNSTQVGQFFYCAPEQFMLLKDGDKRSDVFSLGRIINFVMTKSPQNSDHQFKNIIEKATSENSIYRYSNAGEMKKYFEKNIKYLSDSENKERINQKIADQVFDGEVERFFYLLSSEALCKLMLQNQIGLQPLLIIFMNIDDKHAKLIIQNVETGFREVCKHSFEDNDIFANFSYTVLKSKFSYMVNEVAANIMKDIAYDINRFNAQRLIENLLEGGLEPMIEDILKR